MSRKSGDFKNVDRLLLMTVSLRSRSVGGAEGLPSVPSPVSLGLTARGGYSKQMDLAGAECPTPTSVPKSPPSLDCSSMAGGTPLGGL